MDTVTGGSFWTITFSHFDMLPFLNFVFIEEFEKTRASFTQPGHFMNTAIKQYLWYATAWIFKEYLSLRFLQSVDFSDGCFIAICVPSTAPRHCGETMFFKKQSTGFINYFKNIILCVEQIFLKSHWNLERSGSINGAICSYKTFPNSFEINGRIFFYKWFTQL